MQDIYHTNVIDLLEATFCTNANCNILMEQLHKNASFKVLNKE